VRVMVAVLLTLVAVGLWEIGQREQTLPASGTLVVTSANSTSAPARSSLRLATFNIHSGYGPDGRQDLARTASMLKVFDIVWLNEVHGGWPDQTVALSELTGLTPLYVPTERRWLRNSFGNALLTRLSIERWVRMPLESHTPGYRNALLSTVRVNGQTWQILQTHLTRGKDRAAQLQSVLAIFRSLKAPAVLMGDLNTSARDAELADLLKEAGVQDAVGSVHPETGDGRIDWIIVRGARVKDAGVVETGASDHPLHWAELEAWAGQP